jgi:hypothetical protein
MRIIKKKPKPKVAIIITRFTASITSPPITVEYSIPKGPKKIESTIAVPTLFGIITTIGLCGALLFMVMAGCSGPDTGA